MATHYSILAWRISQTVHGVAKELDKSERLNNSNNVLIRDVTLFLGARKSLLAALLTPRLPIWDLCWSSSPVCLEAGKRMSSQPAGNRPPGVPGVLRQGVLCRVTSELVLSLWSTRKQSHFRMLLTQSHPKGTCMLFKNWEPLREVDFC